MLCVINPSGLVLGRFWRSSSTLTSNEGLSSSEAELRSMHNNGQTKLMNRFMNWSKIFNNKERSGTLPTPGTYAKHRSIFLTLGYSPRVIFDGCAS